MEIEKIIKALAEEQDYRQSNGLEMTIDNVIQVLRQEILGEE